MPHKFFSQDELRETAEKYTKVITTDSDTGCMLFSEYGARLLGLFPKMDEANVLWNPHDLDKRFSQSHWCVGGERLWLSPERDYYYENPRDFEGHHVAPAMDPGNYRLSGTLSFENAFSILNYSTNQVLENCFSRRSFAPINDPYATGLSYAGVRIEDTMALGSENIQMCPWSLAMVYVQDAQNPGTAFFPLRKGGTILSYFNPIPENRADVQDGYARFRIDAAEIYKLGLRPEDMLFDNPCKAVYVAPCPETDDWFCVIKRSDDMPRTQQECVDPAKSNPDGHRGATQSYNAGPGPLAGMTFGEIELQLSPGKHTKGVTMGSGAHELLSYAGSKEEMLELARKALGTEAAPLPY